MKTTNWDFYLTGDRPESGYLRFKIGNVRLGKEESRWFGHEEATLYYDYVVDPEVITEKPKGFILSLDGKGQILRPTPNTAPLICGACYNTQPEDLLTMA